MDEPEIGVGLEDGRIEEDEPDVDADGGLDRSIRHDQVATRKIRDAHTMPSLSLLIPWSKTFRRALSSAARMSLSGGPSRSRRSSDIVSAAGDVRTMVRRCLVRDTAVVLGRKLKCIGASLLARVLPPAGERLLKTRRVGLASRPAKSRSLCCEISPGGGPEAEALRAAAPKLCADWSLRSWRWARGEGGACRSVMDRPGASAGRGSRDGLDMSMVCRRPLRRRPDCAEQD
jgi:hypothetical protein